jgi:type VII secretion protein EccE
LAAVTTTRSAQPRLAPTPISGGPGRLGRVQLVALELAVIAVGGAVFADRPVAVVATGIAAVVLLAVTFGRSKRRWAYESIAARRRLRRRRQAASVALRQPGGPGSLAALAPGLTVRPVVDRGTAIGVGQDELGWFAAAVVAPWTGLSGARAATLPMDRLTRLLAEGSLPVSTLQVVTHQVPAPSAGMDGRTPCASSYRELVGQAPVVTDQQTWIAVRLGPRDGAEAAAERGGGLAGVDRALAAGLGRIGAVLDSAGLDHRVLDADALRQALTVSCGLHRLGGAVPVARSLPAPVPVAERRTYWQAAGALHVCFAVGEWPAQPPPGLLAELTQVPLAAAVDSAVVLRPVEDGLAVRALIRVAAAPDRMNACVQHLLAIAGRVGVRLTRLDGEQAPAVYATAPTGAALGIPPW